MTNPEKLLARNVEADDAEARGPFGEKAKAKEKHFQKALAIVTDLVIITCDKSGVRHATTAVGDIYDTTHLNAARLGSKIKKAIREKMGVRISKTMLAELIEELYEHADSTALEIMEVHHRVALGTEGQFFIDLQNETFGVLEVNKNGYRHHDFISEIPLFHRPQGMMALPNPVGIDGNLDLLRNFVNIRSEGDWRLLIVFILYSLRPTGPYVILVISGTAGSSKSTFSRIVRHLIDPSSVSTQAIPKSIADLMITASNSHLLVFDNVRTLSVEMSDALCRLATGGGSRTRALYTNNEETLIHVTKPCILNGIDDVASQPDLVSRCILMDLPTIKVRRTEEDLNRQFAASIDAIFAGLMDTLSKTLAELENVTDAADTRMADFAHFGMAVERAMNWPTGSFKEAYAQNQQEQMSNSLGDDPLASAVRSLVNLDMEVDIPYTKTPTALLEALSDFASHTQTISKAWPQSPHSLSKRLKKLEPALRACGVGIAFHHSGNRTISVTRLPTFKK